MDDKVRSRVGRYREGSCGCLWEFLELFTRFWGVATAIVLSGVGVELSVNKHLAGVFVVLGSIIVFFLEIMWVITLFIDLCTNENEYSSMLRCWDGVLRCRGIRRSPVYALGALIMAIWPGWTWPAKAAAAALLILSILHIVNTTLPKAPVPLLPKQRHHLVTDAASDCTERYDDITEVLDDSFPTPVANNVHSEMVPSIRDQEAILEI